MMREGYKETEIGVIPVDWEAKQLSDFSELTSSKRVHLSDYVDVGIPFYRGKEITLLKKNEPIDDLLYISEEQYNKIKNQFGIPMKNDILITAVGTLANTYRIPNDKPFYFKDGNLIWLKDILENSPYIDFTLGFHKKKILDSAIGSSQKALTIKELKKVKLPLPPLKEQEKIADILSTVDNKIEAIATQIGKAETLKKGLLQKLLSEGIGHTEFKDSELGRIPVGWEVTFLDNVTKRGTGHTPNKQYPSYWNGGIKWVSLSDSSKMDDRYIYNTDKEISIDGIENSSATIHPKDTVILVRDAGVGKSAILSEKMAVSQHFIAWVCNQNLNYIFLYYWLQSKKTHFERIAIGSTIKTIGMPYFKKLKISLPQIEEQKKIANILSTADDKLEVLRAKKEKYVTLKQGLMQKLLTGEVRV